MPTANATTCSAVGSRYYGAGGIVGYGSTISRSACPISGQKTAGYGAGADQASDCGHVLHVGDDVVYLKSGSKPTTPALQIAYKDTDNQTRTYYGKMSTTTHKMSGGSGRSLKINKNGTVYYVYDEISEQSSAYTPVEYLEASGEQYIDTGVVGNLNTSYEITVEPTNATGTYAVFGSRTSATENSIMTTVSGDSLYVINDFGNYQTTRQQQYLSSILTKMTMTNGKSSRSVHLLPGGQTYNVTTQYSTAMTTPTNLFIGNASVLAGLKNVTNFVGKIYGVKIWNNGTLVRDMIPVVDANNTPAMFDKVSGRFFYNAGSGNFTTGAAAGSDSGSQGGGN